MKSKITVILFLFSICFVAQLSAQNRKSFDVEAFKKRKAEYIIKHAELSDSEAKTFIPLANELMDKRFELHRQQRRDERILRKKEKKTDADYEKVLNKQLELRDKELQLEKEYMLKFKRVLSAEKIYKFQQAEHNFMTESFKNHKHKP